MSISWYISVPYVGESWWFRERELSVGGFYVQRLGSDGIFIRVFPDLLRMLWIAEIRVRIL